MEHWSMGHVKMHKKQKDFKYGSKMEGAILVSNRAIKQECIVKKLFGLPSHMSNLTEKIKAGMLLFLYEHEERKLYGVFEATSDGAMNIVSDAFHFSGESLPAQVPFRRVWMCRPLWEDEFCHAIANYHSPKKFDFSLSNDQVFMLVQLFHLRRINITHNLNHITNKIIRMFEKDYNNTEKSSWHIVKALNCHLIDHELQLQSKVSLNASIYGWVSACSTYDQHDPSRYEISPLSKDPAPVSNADSSNSADVSFERYDQPHPISTYVQESMKEVINSLSSYCICYDTKKNNFDIDASKSVLYNESEKTYPFIKSKLQSDVDVKTGVFSRLSLDPKTAMKRKSFSGSDNLIMMEESSKQSKKLERNTRRRSTSMLLTDDETDVESLYEHNKLELLSAEEKTKPESGSKHVEVETKVVCHDEPDNTSVCLNNSLLSECNQGKVGLHVFNDGSIAEERQSFKVGETDVETLYEHNKLELLSAEGKIKPENGSKHIRAETKAVPHDESEYISLCLKNTLPSECVQTKVFTDDSEKGHGCRKKEVTSRNLLWFLQKTKDP